MHVKGEYGNHSPCFLKREKSGKRQKQKEITDKRERKKTKVLRNGTGYTHILT